MNYRVGQGFDAHRWADHRKLILGGVEIPHTQGLLGHSDADVLLHAICDALLGAAGMGDIGRHFPDTDAKYKDISSRVLLIKVGKNLQKCGYKIGNIDATIICQKPKLAPFMRQMEQHIAEDLKIANTQVNVKATTTERMGFTGRNEGVASMAVAAISSEHL
ncbi:2-C-methyl-D-erythritol 2,4-cyclodiphosphate synthase [Magnetococcales bacterium HHB-1]